MLRSITVLRLLVLLALVSTLLIGGAASAATRGVAQLAVSPVYGHNFGNVVSGSAGSTEFTFTAKNTGGTPSGALAVSLGGPNPTQFKILGTGSCMKGVTTLAAGATCTINVKFNPTATATGNKSATLEVSASPGGLVHTAVYGTATHLALSPATGHAFGSVVAGSAGSAAFTFTVKNTGTAPSGALTVSLGGTNPHQFNILGTGTCVSGTTNLAVGATCTIKITFKPTTTGNKSATLSVSSSPGGIASATLTGTGTNAHFTLSPTSHAFGSVVAGSAGSAAFTFTARNTGTAPSGAFAVSLSGANPKQFNILGTGTCVSGTTNLAVGATCTIKIAFKPTTAGNKSATLNVSSSPGGIASATLTGTGTFPPTAITAGATHTCALLSDGSVRCWGSNELGELGDGTTTDSPTPVAVSGITNATAIAAGGDHTCALLADGSVECWGNNQEGQLGNGTMTTSSSTPVSVSGITTATAIAGGYYYTCAVLADGSVKCWGDNGSGDLGDGTTTPSSTPVSVSGITTATAIAAGYQHTCALLADGSVNCWGWNYYGQLGNGTSGQLYRDSYTPVAVSGITTVTAITAGFIHTCALLAGGAVNCWGDDTGNLDAGAPTDSSTPVPVSGITTATAITAGYDHTCAPLSDGSVRCWGNNDSGQLGDGTTSSTPTPTPVTVSGITTATAIAAGFHHTCALLAGGSVECWGRNSSGQLGDGTTTDSSTPVSVIGL